MKASDITFDGLRNSAISVPSLATVLSYVQVEYGLRELRSFWQGFSDSCDYYGNEFESKSALLGAFADALRDHYVEEPLPI